MAEKSLAPVSTTSTPPPMAALLREHQIATFELMMQNEMLEQARRESEQEAHRMRQRWDTLPVGLLSLNPAGIACDSNARMVDLLGTRRDEIVDHDFHRFVAEEDCERFDLLLAYAFDGGQRESGRIALCSAGGKFPARVEIERASDGDACRVVVADDTRMQRIEEERAMDARLESTSTLVAGLAHDFNNLLAVVLMSIELARVMGEADHALSDLLARAREAALHAAQLTQKYLSLADGGVNLRRVNNVGDILRSSVSRTIEDTSAHCDFQIAPHLPSIAADPGQLAVAFQNITENALDAMGGTGTLHVLAETLCLAREECPGLPAGSYLRIVFRDSGVGIAPELLPRVFDPYLSTKQRGPRRGMGLGLTVCRAIVRKHAGKIAISAVPTGGTEVVITLPSWRRDTA
jgi:PAS domain S-box-containing protein